MKAIPGVISKQVPPVSFLFFQWHVTKVRTANNLLHITEVYLYNDNTRLSFTGATATGPGTFSFHPAPHGIDNNTQTPVVTFFDINEDNAFTFTIQMPQVTKATSFSYLTGDWNVDRDPVRWTMSGSTDDITYVVLHSQTTDYVPPSGRLVETQRFNFL